MKLNAVGVSSTNLKKTAEFYNLLGFEFPEFRDDEQHLEALNTGTTRLMIDSHGLIKNIIGEDPRPSNHSSFAIEYQSAAEVDEIVEKIKSKDFKIVKEPWDAFWGQRYAIVEDPDGYKVDLYALL